jgi:hypothetical protein
MKRRSLLLPARLPGIALLVFESQANEVSD